MKLKSFMLLTAWVSLSTQIAAQDEPSCGEQPAEPALVDGATATMEELVSNSNAVNTYIAEADQFLDCSERRYKQLSSSKFHSDELAREIKKVTDRRNDIGDEFNAQVAAFKTANPE